MCAVTRPFLNRYAWCLCARACTQVAYREAITRPAEVDYTHKKQSGGSGQFARVKLNFVPADMDEEGATSDFEFVSEIKGGAVPKEYIPGVQKASCCCCCCCCWVVVLVLLRPLWWVEFSFGLGCWD